MALNRLKPSLISRLWPHQSASLSTVTIKLDGKPVSIDDLPKKPKSVNLFQNYCAELGVSRDELKAQREQLVKSFNQNKTSYLAKNKKLVDSYKNELKAYREVFNKKIQLKDVADLIEFCNKAIAKETARQAAKASRKPRSMSFYTFFIQQASKDGLGKDLKTLSEKYRNLSSSELEHYKRLHENYLRSSN